MVLQRNGSTQDSLKETKGESDIHLYVRKEEMFYLQAHTHTSTDMCERQRWGRWKDKQTERQRRFHETRNYCMMRYDHSVWPTNKDED